MFWIYTFLYIFNFDKIGLNTLFLSGFIILLLSPYELFSLGFILSFGATLGIMMFLKEFQSIIPGTVPFIRDSIAITLSAQVFVMPFIAVMLNEINFTGLLTNIAAVPATAVLITLTLIAQIISLFSEYISLPFIRLSEIIVDYGFSFIGKMSQLKGHFNIGDIKILILPYLLFISVLLIRNKYKYLKSAILLLSLSFMFYSQYGNSAAFNKEFFIINDRLVILNDDYNYIIIGNIGKNDTAKIMKIIDRYDYQSISIIIVPSKKNSIKLCRPLIKKYKIDTITIFNNFSKNYKIKKTDKLLQQENITFTINNIDKIIIQNQCAVSLVALCVESLHKSNVLPEIKRTVSDNGYLIIDNQGNKNGIQHQ